MGAFDGGSPMSHVDLRKSQCPMSLNLPCPMSPLRYPNVACRFSEMVHVVSLIQIVMSLGSMSRVDFKKRSCRPVDFKDQGPQHGRLQIEGGMLVGGIDQRPAVGRRKPVGAGGLLSALGGRAQLESG